MENNLKKKLKSYFLDKYKTKKPALLRNDFTFSRGLVVNKKFFLIWCIQKNLPNYQTVH